MMKKYLNYAYVSAIAFLGTYSFTACTSSDDVVAEEQQVEVENNPTYDPVNGIVKSQFVLNIASKPQTRSGATTVQAGGDNFRGIDNTLLFAFKTSGKGFVDATFAETGAAARYDLGTVAAAGTLDNDGSNSHRILELAMPTGTDAMLFYGKAIKGNSPDYNEIGKVTYTVSGKQAKSGTTPFHFDLNSRVADNTSRFTSTAQLLAAILTKIINVSGTYNVNMATYPEWTGSASLSSTWKDLNPSAQGRDLSPLEDILFKAFTTLTSYGPNELRGGSSKAVLTTVDDLHSVILKVASATPTSPYEELAKIIASAINTQINEYFTNNVEGFKAVTNIKSIWGDGWNSNWDAITDEELADFPVVSFTLPEGAAQLEYSGATNKFTHKTPGTSLLNKATTTDPSVYQFPAELMYYCNSGVRTSNAEKNSAGYPNGVGNWDDNDQWTAKGWPASSNTVTSATRATAMTKNVNYGVAMLKTTVSIKEGLASLEDNRHALNSEEANQSFNPEDIDFTWTGIIVGGQPGSVDWQFLPTTTDFDKLVYDNRIAGNIAGTAVPNAAGSASSPNYTILFDNYINDASQNKVRVALQFKNNGDNFWGRDNMIRKGQTFYLVAELDPTSKTITSWDTHYQIPPLNASGISTQTTRVFVQDYMTTANFNITTNSLQNAFITLPDLRSSQLSFGLSVDLDWRPGLTFNEDLGGN